MLRSPVIPLPKGWTKVARMCVLHAISVARPISSGVAVRQPSES